MCCTDGRFLHAKARCNAQVPHRRQGALAAYKVTDTMDTDIDYEILGHAFALQGGICCCHVILLEGHTAYSGKEEQ